MNKVLSTVALLAITGNMLIAGGDIAPVEPVVPEVEVVVSDSWEYSASLYLFMADIGGETAFGNNFTMDFNDIIDSLNFAFMGTLGAQKGKWGIMADVMYLDVEDDVNIPLGPLGLLNITNVELKNWVFSPIVTYRVIESDQMNLDLLAGARYLYLKGSMEINNRIPWASSDDIWDGIVGVRGTYDLNDKWYIPFQLDIGAGATDLTWQAFAAVGYKFENWDLLAGYRYLEWNFDDSDTGGDKFNDLNFKGPIIGAKFHF
jgi:hypothetical protein